MMSSHIKRQSQSNHHHEQVNSQYPRSKPSVSFVDNRAETKQAKSLQDEADSFSKGTSFQALQKMADDHFYNSDATVRPQPFQLHSVESGHGAVQRVVKVGTDTYRPYKRGFGIKDLTELVESNKGTASLRYDWKARVKEYVNAAVVTPHAFSDLDDLIDYLTKSSKKKTTSQKNKEQDDRILGLNTGYGADELYKGKILEYESQKAFGNFTGQIAEMDEYKDEMMELEGMSSGLRSTTNDFTKSDNPFVNMMALGNSNLKRLDYMADNDVEINTQGYSSMGDRSVDPNTLPTSFGYGTVKIGPDISTYMKEMESTSRPNQDQMDYLNHLEMHRFPNLATQTGMKRELYNQGHFSKDQGMCYQHDHSSVEFVGAISGSTMTKQQLANMRRQQTMSNYAILETANKICPNAELGSALSNGKHVPTSQEEMQALNSFISVIQDANSSSSDKDNAKQHLRKVLVQILRGVTGMEDVLSEDEDNYPTSPYNETDYS
ncbi:MAG: hypothetical protein AAFX87_09915 [Bacteroidota bacterium]